MGGLAYCVGFYLVGEYNDWWGFPKIIGKKNELEKLVYLESREDQAAHNRMRKSFRNIENELNTDAMKAGDHALMEHHFSVRSKDINRAVAEKVST